MHLTALIVIGALYAFFSYYIFTTLIFFLLIYRFSVKTK